MVRISRHFLPLQTIMHHSIHFHLVNRLQWNKIDEVIPKMHWLVIINGVVYNITLINLLRPSRDSQEIIRFTPKLKIQCKVSWKITNDYGKLSIGMGLENRKGPSRSPKFNASPTIYRHFLLIPTTKGIIRIFNPFPFP